MKWFNTRYENLFTLFFTAQYIFSSQKFWRNDFFRPTMKLSRISSILLTLASVTSSIFATNQTYIETENSIWYDVGEVAGMLLKTCLDTAATPKNGMEFIDIFQNCLRRKGLLVLNRSLKADVISIGNGIQLVKYKDANSTYSDKWVYEKLDHFLFYPFLLFSLK